MVTQEQVRHIAFSLPETGEYEDRFGFCVFEKGKRMGIAWVWLEQT